jgi:hypothetical protein
MSRQIQPQGTVRVADRPLIYLLRYCASGELS